MKKKILALMLIFPILFILIIYTAALTAQISADIPVSRIRIINETQNGVLAIDMTNSTDVFIDVEVLPALAKNKKFSFIIENLQDTPEGNINIDQDTGRLVLNGTGNARLVVRSNDGGFTDSITILVTSSAVLNFKPQIITSDGENVTLNKCSAKEYDYEAVLGSAVQYCFFGAEINPSSLAHTDIIWSSSDADVMDINAAGIGTSRKTGTTVIEAVLDNGEHGEIRKSILLKTEATTSPSGILVNGKTNAVIYTPRDCYNAEFLVQIQDSGELNINGSFEKCKILPLGEELFSVQLQFGTSRADEEQVLISLKGKNKPSSMLGIIFAEYDFNIVTSYDNSSNGIIFQKNQSTTSFAAYSKVDGNGLEYRWQLSDNKHFEIFNSTDGKCVLYAKSDGAETLTLTVLKNSQIIETVHTTVQSVRNIGALTFEENSKEYGIEGTLTLGDKILENGVYKSFNARLGLMLKTFGKLSPFDGYDVEITVSDENIATAAVTSDGLELVIHGTGEVLVLAKWKYSDYFKDEVAASIRLRVVQDAVNVADYEQIFKAAEDGKTVVLQRDIMLGKANAGVAELKKSAHTMPTSYDWRFYRNQGKPRPEVYYLIEFKNDVYGNGYELNAEYIANAKDRTGKPLLFKGPLDFVSIGTAAVKGQDNVSFLIRTDSVVLDNVILRGCKDESLIEEGSLNLSLLNYVGTTLEISAKNVVLKNCRISNGRTVVRIFGGGVTNGSPIVENAFEVNVEKERAQTVIQNCILSNAREFILKIGSNRAIDAKGDSKENFSVQTLNKADGTPYNQFENNLDDEYFVKNYLITDVTLCDSVLQTSGIFAIGAETHFSGIMLDGHHFLSTKYWYDLAATSFASALRLEGDVRIYDWKRLDDIDSSTLIETTGGADAYLNFNIPAMLQKIYSVGGTEFKNIVSEIEGIKYVHCGIAFYGGGYNYSSVLLNGFSGEGFHDYRINISILAEGETDKFSELYLQGTLIPAAAGEEDFRFYIYGADSRNSYFKQLDDLADGSAYEPVFKKYGQ